MLAPLKISQFHSGQWIKQYQYQSFLPESINRQWDPDDPELQALTSEAHRYLGELNAFSQLVPDVDFFIMMHISKEAVTSSRIEGTRTNIEEVFLKEEDIIPEKRDDWQEVKNYIQTMNYAMEQL